MEIKKKEWEDKKKVMQIKKIQLKQGGANGKYEGQVQNGKPHGLGIWQGDDGKYKVEGEWNNGRYHGRAVHISSNGDHFEYETKDGKFNGKYIWYKNDANRVEREYKDGKQHGRQKQYNKDGVITSEAIYENGQLIKKIK